MSNLMHKESLDSERPNIVIVGAGFGGLEAAKVIGNKPVSVTLIDKNNHHLFQPLLYQVATAALTPADIAVPIRFILRRRKNIRVLMGEVLRVDLSGRRVVLADQEIGYDYLILATGATHTYFGENHWAEVAPGLKTISEAIEIRRRILTAFETAERCTNGIKRNDILSFAVIGGGATGVELAGAIADLARIHLVSDFRRIDPLKARILLLEAGPRLLPALSEKLARKAMESLRGLGVEVLLNAPVTDIAHDHIVAAGREYRVRTVIWSAGVRGSALAETLGTPLGRSGKVLVNEDLSLQGHPEVFVVGDLASVAQLSGRPVPALAPAAIQEGRHASLNVLRMLKGMTTKPFRYVDKGTLATIGRSKAVAELGRFEFSGFPAWIVWLGAHIFFLIGFRNRVFVLLQWAWAYVTYHSYSRLITYPWASWTPGLPDRQLPEFPGCPCERGIREEKCTKEPGVRG
jgi:NADH dehydrogenase